MMIYKKDKISEINSIQLDILRTVIKVINELSLSYFLVHGSLLGAARTSGFIPFDDDIDIAMPRKDYDIFISEAQKFMPSNIFVQSYMSEKKYPLSFAKVRNSDTTYLSNKFLKCNINQGIYIDIFPIDYVGNKKSKIRSFLLKIADYRISALIKEKKGFRRVLCLLSYFIFPALKFAISYRENMVKKIESSNYVAVTGGKDSEKKIPSSWFKNTSTLLFCDIVCVVPSNYKEYLSCIYGNYLDTTLLENRYSDLENVEMNADIINTKTSYKFFLR